MDKGMELHQTIYGLLRAQIEFGAYRYEDPLPKMEDASQWFSVSLDTVRAAYHQLKTEGYITVTKKAGAAVAIRFQEEELERNIQTFFSLRKAAVLDLCQSLGPLFGHAQWFALKNAGPERLDELERLCAQPATWIPYMMVQHVRVLYGALHNDLLLRLIWQAFLFYQVPFLSLPDNLAAFEEGDAPLRNMLNLCRRKDWDGLWQTVAAYQEQLTSAIEQFYTTRITLEPPGKPVPFHWSAYRNASQRCYSLAIDLLKGIRLGVFAQDGFLPSPATIAEYGQVSTITVRRTLILLNQLGATRSINGVGTQVLTTGDSLKNCDFSQPVIRKRLLDFAQSLQILAMTCGGCAKSIAANVTAVCLWKDRLAYIKKNFRYESVVFASLEIIAQYSAVQAVREIYDQLLQVLLWGYPLRSMHGSREEINQFYLPYVNALRKSLKNGDWAALAAELESLLFYELRFAVARLNELGIKEAASLVIPGREG